MAPIRRLLAGSLQMRLTILYATLFAAALLVTSLVVYAAVSGAARNVVRAELQAGGTVFDRLWTMRARQLGDSADLLARDFGFRAAFATGDGATIASALENLKGRLGVDRAFVIGVDGQVLAAAGASAASGAPLADALMADEEASGVILLDGAPHQAISAPILSPALAGWVVFTSRLDAREMRTLERLSSIPLHSSVMFAQGGRWSSEDKATAKDAKAIAAFVDKRLKSKSAGVDTLNLTAGRAIAVVKPLKSMTAEAPTALLLRYPLATALEPYRGLLAAIVGIGLLGLAMVVIGSWALARELARPIKALDAAAHRLQAGEDVEVQEITNDEVGRLARSFNAMATEIRARERRITHLAHHDGDTGLPNRLALERQLGLTSAADGLTVVAAFGIERFAEVRGAIGYGLAGRLIAELGGRLAGPDLTVGRISTDVLGVVFTAGDLSAAMGLAQDLRASLENPIIIDGATVDIAVTGGLAARPLHASRAGALIDRANIALDQARKAQRAIGVFDEEAYGDPSTNLSLMSEMLEGLEQGHLTVHYQPKHDLRAGEVTAVEALVRWRHPVRGPLSPDLFVRMAEETGNIRALTDFVLKRAVADQKIMSRAARRPIKVSVNISGRLLGDPSFGAAALAIVAGAEEHICFEITETAVIEHPEAALAFLDKLADCGVEVSIDDYGSGLSSLAYLKRIQAGELKIDREFIKDLARSQRDALLVRSTIDMAHSLGMKVTAEGVEEEPVLAMLQVMGCDMAQGYGVARPMPVNDLLSFLDQTTVNGQNSAGGIDGQAGGHRAGAKLRRRTGVRAG